MRIHLPRRARRWLPEAKSRLTRHLIPGLLICAGISSLAAQAREPAGEEARLFAVNGLSDDISTVAIRRLAFRSLGGAPTGEFPVAAAVDPGGEFLFVVNSQSDDISLFRVSNLSQGVVPLGSTRAGDDPSSLVVSSSGDFVYVLNDKSNDVAILRLDRSTATLTRLGAVSTGRGPRAAAITPDGRFLLTANRLTNDLSVFARSSDGSLSEVECRGECDDSGRVPVGVAPQSIAVSPNGRFVLVANRDSGDLSEFRFDAARGALTSVPCAGNCRPSGRVSAGKPEVIAFSPQGRLVYVADRTAGIMVFGFDPESGALFELRRLEVAEPPQSLVVSADGRFLIVTYDQPLDESPGIPFPRFGGSLAVYEVFEDGQREPRLAGSASGDSSSGVAITPDGKAVFVAGQSSNQVSVFDLDTETGAVRSARLSPGAAPSSQVLSPSGKYLLVSNSESDDLSIVSVDEDLGRLVPHGKAPVGRLPISVAVSMDGRLVVVANAGSDDLSVFEFDETTGGVRPLQTVPTGGTPTSVAISPDGRLVFVTNFSSGTLGVFEVDSHSGKLGQQREVAAGTEPVSVTVSADGRWVLVADQRSSEPGGAVEAFERSPDGRLTLVSRAVVLGAPRSVSMSPGDGYVFVAHASSNVISVLRFDNVTGHLTTIRLVPAGRFPISVSVSPDNRFVFVANFGEMDPQSGDTGADDGGVSVFRFDSATGSLCAVSRLSVGTSPVAVSISPSGRLAVVANFGSNDLGLIRLDENALTLDRATFSFSVGLYPVSVASSPDGRFAVVANLNSNDVRLFSLRSPSGALLGRYPAPAPRAVAISPDGRHVVVADSGSDDVAVFRLDAGSESLSLIGRTPVGAFPVAVAVSDRLVFVANQGSSDLAVLDLDPATGTLRPLSRTPTGGFPLSVAVSGDSVFVANVLSTLPGLSPKGSVESFGVDRGSGALTRLDVRPAGLTTVSVAVSGSFVMACNRDSNNVNVFRWDALSGSLAEVDGSPFAVGELPVYALAPPGLGIALVADAGAGELTVLRVDGSSGRLTTMSRVATGDLPLSLAVSPAGVVLVANGNSDSVTVLRLDPGVGVSSNPRTGRGPRSIQLHPSGRFAYVSNLFDDSVSIYSVTPEGDLSPFLGAPTVRSGSGPSALVLDAEGRHLYVTNSGADTVSVYGIENGGASLTLVQECGAGAGPYDLQIGPDGRFLFVANFNGNSISVFRRDSETGRLSLSRQVPTRAGPLGLAIDEAGRFLYSANFGESGLDGNGSVTQFEIAADGNPIERQTLAVGRGPVDLATLSVGDAAYLYVVNAGSDSISEFLIDNAGGITAMRGGEARTGAGPVMIAVDPAGGFVYVSNSAANTISVFRVLPNGELTFERSVPSGLAPQGLVATPGNRP